MLIRRAACFEFRNVRAERVRRFEYVEQQWCER
jgi:hypothetical protein